MLAVSVEKRATDADVPPPKKSDDSYTAYVNAFINTRAHCIKHL